MIAKVLEKLADKMVLVTVCDNNQQYVFDRAQFATWYGNRSARPIGVRPERAARSLLRLVTQRRNPKFVVVRSPALGQIVHFVFWFPAADEFAVENWQGKVAEVHDLTMVTKEKRRVIEAALARAREKLTIENLRKIA